MSLLAMPGREREFPLREVLRPVQRCGRSPFSTRSPELSATLSTADIAAVMAIRAHVLPVERGSWRPPTFHPKAHYHLGLLILDGVVLRRVALNGRSGAELLGRGDLLQPWVRQPAYDMFAPASEWDVLERCRLALLDERFALRVAPWPEVTAALLRRLAERARMLAFQHVASHMPGLDARLLTLLWALADCWGRVTHDGVLIPLRLTPATLAELVGASRPSVSTALAQLARDGALERKHGGWLLGMTGISERVDAGGARTRTDAMRSA